MKTFRNIAKVRRAVLAALVYPALAGVANASITVISYTESATSFQATYAFTQDGALLDGEGAGLGNWSAILTQQYNPLLAQYIFTWEGSHLAAPHAGEFPALLPTVGNCAVAAGTLTGTFCEQSTSVPHGAGHYDMYSFALEFFDGAGLATFTGTHVGEVPVPAAAWLLLSGVGGLLAASRRNFKRTI